MKSIKTAIIITSFNRKEITLLCLGSLLISIKLLFNNLVDIYLVDDNSTDGTKQAVHENFPSVIIINGNGSLYWNRGMHLAWEIAAKTKKYDYFLWLNDENESM